jgi:rare lipoprotein A
MRKTLSLAFVTALGLLALSPAANAVGSRVCGGASFYGKGDGFAWQTTASGVPMDPNAMTTAHRSLPFGTRIQVTNNSNGKSVIVRVTDRGPFVGGRVVDLSYGAFSAIAAPSTGVTNVCYTRLS